MAENKGTKRILFLSNHFITLYSFRRELIQRLTAQGHEVYISVPKDERNEYFEKLGCQLVDTPMSRRGANPIQDAKLILSYVRIMRALRPDVIFSYTVKPNIYGAMVANPLGLRQVSNITGTGATFMKRDMMSFIVKTLYRLTHRRVYKVFFQNTGDRDFFVSHRLVRDNYAMLPGSGVNLRQHCLCPMPEGEGVNFIYIGRIMALKGLEQYLDCARYIRAKYPETRFYVAGFIEEERFGDLLRSAADEGAVEYLGFQKDIDRWIRACHCTILPSMGGEGVPNALLESAATGRVCIASRINGCIDAVEDGRTGYLFTPGSSEELIDSVERFLSLSRDEMAAMGLAGREKMEREFDRELVIERYMQEV